MVYLVNPILQEEAILVHPCTSFAEDFLLVHKGEDNGGPFFKETKNTVVDTTTHRLYVILLGGRKTSLREKRSKQKHQFPTWRYIS